MEPETEWAGRYSYKTGNLVEPFKYIYKQYPKSEKVITSSIIHEQNLFQVEKMLISGM